MLCLSFLISQLHNFLNHHIIVPREMTHLVQMVWQRAASHLILVRYGDRCNGGPGLCPDLDPGERPRLVRKIPVDRDCV
jgi:hypothetical protein